MPKSLEELFECVLSLSDEEIMRVYEESLAKAQKESQALIDARKIDWKSAHEPCTI